MGNKSAALLVVGVLAVSLHGGQTQAGSDTPDFISEAAATTSATAIIANATRAAYAYRDSQRYDYDYDISNVENAVAACFHAADHEVRRKRRGLHARLDEVKKVKQKGERLKVTMRVTNFYRNGETRRWVKCHVRHDRVVFLKYT